MEREKLRRLRDDAYDQFKRNSLDPENQLGIDALYRSIDPYARIVLTDDGFQEFLADYLSRERTKLDAAQRGDPDDHPHEGVRKRPMCTCSDRYCPLKDGRLPRQIRDADNLVAAVRSFKHSHGGEALVLADATDERDELRAEVAHTYRRVMIAGMHNKHPDELDEAFDAIDEDDEGEEPVDETADAVPADD